MLFSLPKLGIDNLSIEGQMVNIFCRLDTIHSLFQLLISTFVEQRAIDITYKKGVCVIYKKNRPAVGPRTIVHQFLTFFIS